jgi:hypothetical protein
LYRNSRFLANESDKIGLKDASIYFFVALTDILQEKCPASPGGAAKMLPHALQSAMASKADEVITIYTQSIARKDSALQVFMLMACHSGPDHMQIERMKE